MREIQYISSDFLAPRDAWDRLSISEQTAMMEAAVSEGVFDLSEIRKRYTALWTYTDTNGKVYSPRQTAAPSQGTIIEKEDHGVGSTDGKQ